MGSGISTPEGGWQTEEQAKKAGATQAEIDDFLALKAASGTATSLPCLAASAAHEVVHKHLVFESHENYTKLGQSLVAGARRMRQTGRSALQKGNKIRKNGLSVADKAKIAAGAAKIVAGHKEASLVLGAVASGHVDATDIAKSVLTPGDSVVRTAIVGKAC